MSSALDFQHRHNSDDTWDSICLGCYLTVATAGEEEDLSTAEHSHDCAALLHAKNAHHLETLGSSDNPSYDWRHYRSEGY